MSIYCYHFATVTPDGIPILANGDGRRIRVGETLTVAGIPVLCAWGLHASPNISDALRYAPSPSVLCRVRLGGAVERDYDKLVATQRTVVAMLSVSHTKGLLYAFARWCALAVARLWPVPMPDVVRNYLETGDESVRQVAIDAMPVACAGAQDEVPGSAWFYPISVARSSIGMTADGNPSAEDVADTFNIVGIVDMTMEAVFCAADDSRREASKLIDAQENHLRKLFDEAIAKYGVDPFGVRSNA